MRTTNTWGLYPATIQFQPRCCTRALSCTVEFKVNSTAASCPVPVSANQFQIITTVLDRLYDKLYEDCELIFSGTIHYGQTYFGLICPNDVVLLVCSDASLQT